MPSDLRYMTHPALTGEEAVVEYDDFIDHWQHLGWELVDGPNPPPLLTPIYAPAVDVEAGADGESLVLRSSEWQVERTLPKVIDGFVTADHTDRTQYVLSNPGSSALWSASIADVTQGNGKSKRFRFAATDNAGSARTWECHNGTTAKDSEVCSTWYGGNGTLGSSGGQQGHIHRAGINPSTGRPWGYIVWHDVLNGEPKIINFGVWTTNGATPPDLTQLGSTNTGVGGITALDTSQYWRGVARLDEVFTSLLIVQTGDGPFRRGWAVGDSLTVTTNGKAGLANSFTAPIASIDATQLALTYTPPAGYDQLDFVTLNNTTRKALPYRMKTRLEGRMLSAKAWRLDEAEPRWGDPYHCWHWEDSGAVGPDPDTAGLSGIEVAHLTSGKYLEYGEVEYRRLR